MMQKEAKLICSQDVDWNGFGRDERPCEHFRIPPKEEMINNTFIRIFKGIIRIVILVSVFRSKSET